MIDSDAGSIDLTQDMEDAEFFETSESDGDDRDRLRRLRHRLSRLDRSTSGPRKRPRLMASRLSQLSSEEGAVDAGVGSSSGATSTDAASVNATPPAEDESIPPKWLKDIAESTGTVPFVAVYDHVMQDGEEKIILTPIQISDADLLRPSHSEETGQSAAEKSVPSSSKTEDQARHSDSQHTSSGIDTIPAARHSTQTEVDQLISTIPDIPVEIAALIARHLAYRDLKNLRLVNKAFGTVFSSQLFNTVVLPFNRDIYGLLDQEAQKQSSAKSKGKGPATGLPEVATLDMFRGFGAHIRRFGISFDVDAEAFANPPNKSTREGHKAYWGKYEWCYPNYVRFSDRAALENAADQTSVMTRALSYLIRTQHLALSLDAGLGWLKGPDMSLRSRVLVEPTAVWGSSRLKTHDSFGERSRFATSPDEAAHRRLWLMLQDSFRNAGREDELRNIEFIHIDHDAGHRLIQATRDLPSITLRSSFLDNVYSAHPNAFRSKNFLVPRKFLNSVPQDIWRSMGLSGPADRPRLTINQLLDEDSLLPLRSHLESTIGRTAGHAGGLLSRLSRTVSRATSYLYAFLYDNHATATQLTTARAAMWLKQHDKDHHSWDEDPKDTLPCQGVIVAVPRDSKAFDCAFKAGSANSPRFLSSAQKEWLLETSWAQDAFISSYMLAITDNHYLGCDIKTLTLSRFSSKHIPRLYRDDFWNGLPNLAEIKLSIIADWRDVIYDCSGSANTVDISPALAVSTVHHLVVTKFADRRNLKRLTLGWADGGEHNEGHYARNKNVLPAALVPREDAMRASVIFADMATFRFLEELTLENCWITPNMLRYLLLRHKDYQLKKLVLDSVSMTAHPRFEHAPPNQPNLQPIWLHVLTTLLPGIQPMGNGQPQPAVVVQGVHQLAAAATAAGEVLPPLVAQFITTIPAPPGLQPPAAAAAIMPGIQPNQYRPVLQALNQALGGPAQPMGAPPQALLAAAANNPALNPQANNNNGGQNLNDNGYRIGSWPEVIHGVTQMLDSAGKSDFEFVFLSCGYVYLPSATFDQTWLRSLNASVEAELEIRNDDDSDDDDDDGILFQGQMHNGQVQFQVANGVVQPGPPANAANAGAGAAGAAAPPAALHPAQIAHANHVNNHFMNFLQANNPPHNHRQLRLARALARDPTDATAPPVTPRRAALQYLSHLRKDTMTSSEPLHGRIVSALPARERTGLVDDWAGIEVGWPTEAMELAEVGFEAPESGTDNVDRRARNGWSKWRAQRREDASWDGFKEGGAGRFSGRMWAREGRVVSEDDDE